MGWFLKGRIRYRYFSSLEQVFQPVDPVIVFFDTEADTAHYQYLPTMINFVRRLVFFWLDG
jgi:hypothetical protein